MIEIIKYYNLAKRFIYDHFNLFLLIFFVLPFVALYTFWWLSFLSICFFIWNYFNEKKYIKTSIICLLITILLIIFDFEVFIPTQEWGDEVQRKWNKTGYDSTWVPASQHNINIITRIVEEYKFKYGRYPDSLSEIQYISVNLLFDLSYRIKYTNGVNGIPFYYEKVGANKFYLAGAGKDGIYKTDDDLLPQISFEQQKTTGLSKYVVKSFSLEDTDYEKRVIVMLKKEKITEKILNIK